MRSKRVLFREVTDMLRSRSQGNTWLRAVEPLVLSNDGRCCLNIDVRLLHIMDRQM